MAQILICNTNDGDRSRTSTYTAGDVISVRPDGFVFGARESIDEWVRQGNNAKYFPNGFIIVSIDMPLVKAKELRSTNLFPLRLSNFNLDFSLLPENVKSTMTFDSEKSMTKGETKHTLTLSELDLCLLPRAGLKKPSAF
ncbi:MAG: hypothetical protein JKY67_12895 [Pseudomonadales bacterium]|nr:hypothetical protein [Pseudomonadales bacterium]